MRDWKVVHCEAMDEWLVSLADVGIESSMSTSSLAASIRDSGILIMVFVGERD